MRKILISACINCPKLRIRWTKEKQEYTDHVCRPLDTVIANINEIPNLSTIVEKAKEVASIHTDDPVLLAINAEEAQKDGTTMLSATENIVLSEEIPAKYLKLMQDDSSGSNIKIYTSLE